MSVNYTSGTTARPKGVMMTHRNSYINAYNFIAHLGVRHDDVELWTLPLFHCNGWGGPFALTAMGATHVVLRAVVGEARIRHTGRLRRSRTGQILDGRELGYRQGLTRMLVSARVLETVRGLTYWSGTHTRRVPVVAEPVESLTNLASWRRSAGEDGVVSLRRVRGRMTIFQALRMRADIKW